MSKKNGIAIVSMEGKLDRFPRLEHCCDGFEKKPVFHVEIYNFYYALKQQGFNARFFNGSFLEEEEILEKLKKETPEKIIYYVYTPFIRRKTEFMKSLSKISKLYLVAVPFFWRDKILKEFPFVEDVWYDGEKGLGIDVKESMVNYDEIDLTPYLGRAFPVLISKYCPFGCNYCNARRTGLMERNLENVKKELQYLMNKGFTKFHLNGNMITIKRETYFGVCRMMKELGIKDWSADGRVDQMEDDMYVPLKESGGTLLFGVESANQEILNHVSKGTKISQVIENADKMNKLKIPFRYTFMFGFPWDSHETFKEMLALRDRVRALNYHVLFLMPYPNHPIFHQMKELKIVNEEDYDFEDFESSFVEPFAPTLYLSKEELSRLAKILMTRRVFSKSVIYNIVRTRKISEYPAIISRGVELLVSGKRGWLKG